MDNQIVVHQEQNQALERAIEVLVRNKRPATVRMYRSHIRDFMDWLYQQPPGLFIDHLENYISHLSERNSPSTVQVKISTIKGLLKMAARYDDDLKNALPLLDEVKPPAVRGQVQGTRLSSPQRQSLVEIPNTDTHIGRRDTCIVLLLSLSGLRRSEICDLKWSHIQELDGHHVIQNLVGKHGRVRTIKLQDQLYDLLMEWAGKSGIDTSPDSPVFVSIHKGDTVQHGKSLTGDAILWIVRKYTDRIGLKNISPHDLRRTAASLARRRGATIEQVQIMLGHASPQTTSNYIGESLDLDDFASDYNDIKFPVNEV